MKKRDYETLNCCDIVQVTMHGADKGKTGYVTCVDRGLIHVQLCESEEDFALHGRDRWFSYRFLKVLF